MKTTIVSLLSLLSLATFNGANAQNVTVIKQDMEFCNLNTDSVFCQKPGLPESISTGNKDPYLKTLLKLNGEIKNRFFAKPEQVDIWSSFGKDFIQNQKINMTGDCEDMTMTAIEYAIHLGVPKERLGRIIVVSYPFANDGNFNHTEIHMVAVYKSPETNSYFYFGDTQTSGITKSQNSTHEPLHVNWLTDSLDWIQVDKL